MMLLTTITLLQTSCKKEDAHNPQALRNSISASNGTVFNFGGKTISTTKENAVQTVLGDTRENPYTLDNMNQAYHNLYDSTYTLEQTHYYVKFTPETYEELINVSDNDILLLDFPYESEVIEMGDYYQILSEGELPELYSVVSIDFDFSDYNYQIIDDLYITDNPFLIVEAYYLKGMYSDVSSIEIQIDDDIILPPRVPPMPEEGCDAPCHWVMFIQNPGNYPPVYDYRCDCPPTPSPDACQTTNHMNKAYGQIKVDDSQLSTAGDPSTYEGVRDIKVFVVDRWFWNYDVVSTNQDGCWHSNRKMWTGARLWAMFIGSKCNVRGVKNNNNIITFPLSFTTGIIHYIGKVGKSSLHNIQVNYTRGAVNTSNDYLYWSAATVNNAVHEFHDYAVQEGINAPPMGLRVFVNPELPGGAALMMSQFTPIDINNWVTSLNVPPSFTNTYFAIMFNPYTAPLFPTVAVALQALGPDVIIGTTSDNSDRIKRLVYHEVAHTSHYTNTGKAYWLDLIIAESNAFLATANAHGNATFADADIIAVAESWAEHVALTFADMTYPTNQVTSISTTYIDDLEQTWNEMFNHIPIGLYHDLKDSGTEPVSWNEDGNASTTVTDNVSGFTNQMMFGCLNANTSSINNFQTQLINTQLANTSNTLTNVNLLFGSY